MSTKEAFERAWFAEFSANVDGTSPPVPSLSCWNSTGDLRSEEALLDELHKCRQRIAQLRRNLRAEEFLESYCQQELNCQTDSGSRVYPKRSASAPHFTNHAPIPELPETAPPLEVIYSEPIDSRLSPKLYYNCERPQSPEGLYAEPVDARCIHRISSALEPMYARPVKSMESTPITPKPSTSLRREQRRAYEEIDDVRAEKVDAGDDSSEDESVANLVAIRQSVSRLSQWCVDGDAARRKLELQAKRLSSRFSHAVPVTGSGARSESLDSVPESLLSPTTPSGMVCITYIGIYYAAHNLLPLFFTYGMYLECLFYNAAAIL